MLGLHTFRSCSTSSFLNRQPFKNRQVIDRAEIIIIILWIEIYLPPVFAAAILDLRVAVELQKMCHSVVQSYIRSHQSVPHNSERFRHGSEKIGLGVILPPPLFGQGRVKRAAIWTCCLMVTVYCLCLFCILLYIVCCFVLHFCNKGAIVIFD
jgi:hypothetical protein